MSVWRDGIISLHSGVSHIARPLPVLPRRLAESLRIPTISCSHRRSRSWASLPNRNPPLRPPFRSQALKPTTHANIGKWSRSAWPTPLSSKANPRRPRRHGRSPLGRRHPADPRRELGPPGGPRRPLPRLGLHPRLPGRALRRRRLRRRARRLEGLPRARAPLAPPLGARRARRLPPPLPRPRRARPGPLDRSTVSAR